ncbi:MAG: GNAT family N-acetyltransferase [Chloroflexi bacterium]|nr:GNAT family N-acetyltransferase [Chloroflexota bacterium]
MVAIRQAKDEDLEALNGLIATLGFHKESGYFERCLAEQAEGRRLVFIAAVDENDVAYGMLNLHPQYTLYRKLGIPEIQDLNVIPAARRRGVATALIDHCENLVRERGGDQVGISVGLYADYGPAQRLYIKLGYVPDGYGVTYDRAAVTPGEIRPIDDNLCLMMVKTLST